MLNTLWRGKIYVLASVLLGLVLGLIASSKIEHPGYIGTAVVRFQKEQSVLDNFQPINSRFFANAYADYQTINTELAAITSHEVIGKLVDHLDLMKNPRYNFKLAKEMGVFVETEKSMLSRLKASLFSSSDSLSDFPIDERTAVIRAVTPLFTVVHQEATFLFTVSAWSDDPVEAQKLSDGLASVYIQDSIDERLEDSEKSTIWLNHKAAELKEELEVSELKIKTFRDQSSLITEQRLSGLNIQLKETRARVVVLNSKLSQINDETSEVAKKLKQQINALSNSSSSLQKTIEAQSNDLVLLQQLKREASANSLLYESFLSRLKEITVQQGLLKSERRLLEPAAVLVAEGQSRKNMVLFYAFLGGLLGMAFVYIREVMTSTIRFPDELEAVAKTTLFGSIPLVQTLDRSTLLNFLHENKNSTFSESIRNLRTSIFLADVDNAPQVIMVTSSSPSEGKTTTSFSLAQNISGLAKKTLLIEGDMRKRVLAEYFPKDSLKEKSDGTLLDVIQGTKSLSECTYSPEGFGVDFLFSGHTTINAADIYASKAFADFIAEARREYDFIVIDTPPVLAVPDARLIASHVDSVIYVVKWNKTTKSTVRDGIALYENFGVKVDGVVLSCVDSKELKRYGYGDRFSYYFNEENDYHTNV